MLRIAMVSLGLAACALSCGPSRVAVSPKSVVNTVVRPASGQLLFCPGDPFQVEVVVKLEDGTSCSTLDPGRGCMGEEGVLDAKLVHLEGSSGGPSGDPHALVWQPDPSALATAASGLSLKAWLEDGSGRSSEGEALLKPVYECRAALSFAEPPPTTPGEHGKPGPEIEVAITTLSTPFYPDAALIRVRRGSETQYLISPSADKPARITARGQDGAAGAAGQSGKPGVEGAAAAADTTCQPGERGGDGEAGTAGLTGGNAGPGPTFVLALDAAAAARLRSRVILVSQPGNPGAGGPGGQGGAGGLGGLGIAGPGCEQAPPRGESGKAGETGAAGPSGQPAAEGSISEKSEAREALFAAEMRVIQSIEATKAK
jgi:hypothetical protein